MSNTKAFKATIELELAYQYTYDPETGIKITAFGMSSDSANIIKALVEEDALKEDVLQKSADLAQQIDTEEDPYIAYKPTFH